MDIEEFYDADPRRRESEEVPFGHEWTDPEGGRYEVMWIADTGEVYAMFEPVEPMASDGVGDIFVQHMPTSAVTVEVLGVIAERADIDERLAGWETAMPDVGSIAWVRERIPSA
ncbi:MAG: hypothetical protein WDA60_06160 [Acidimicrobiia bacterium]|jgi:hypothetical protein